MSSRFSAEELVEFGWNSEDAMAAADAMQQLASAMHALDELVNVTHSDLDLSAPQDQGETNNVLVLPQD